MFQRLNTETLNWILIIGVILFIAEIVFFNGGLIISALFSGLFIYFGWKNFVRLWGKILFWIGLISLVLSILNMLAVRFLVIVAIVLFIMNYVKKTQEAEKISPDLITHQEVIVDPMVIKQPLFHHKIFDDQQTDQTAYQWRDINIHGGFGDRIIDLSNTVLPNDTAVVSIRHFVGNVEIYVPYEVEVSIHHSSIFGRAHILGKHHLKIMNESLIYQTEKYDTTSLPRVKIITSIVSGDIEVKRI
ncbi:cell wall-active antibiotics response protein LiaF [Ornithinibacillus salinisoli]|uniref:Cell wall-active antibiotics response protein LiaF n=1 Tax=Ornithinibacillus salinisoli TaxID=1848459 RepID=A0ABW4W168_9BACI